MPLGWMESVLRKVYENSSDEMKRRMETGMEEGRHAAIEGYKNGAGMVSSENRLDKIILVLPDTIIPFHKGCIYFGDELWTAI